MDITVRGGTMKPGLVRFKRDLLQYEGLFQSLIVPSLSIGMKTLMGADSTSAVADGDLTDGSFGSTEVDGSSVISEALDAITPISQKDVASLFDAVEAKVSSKGVPANPDLKQAMPLMFPFNDDMYTVNLSALQWLWTVSLDDELTDMELIAVVREYWSSPWNTSSLPTVFMPIKTKDKNAFSGSALPTMLIQPPVACDWPIYGAESGGQPLSGASIILGGPGAGKTTYTFNRLNADVVIRVGERPEQVDIDPRVIFARSMIDAIGLAWWFALLGAHVVIDSLRSLAYGLKGAAAEKGIKTALFNAVTDMSCLFNLTQNHVVMTLNPLISDEGMEVLFNHLTGSASGVLWLHNKGKQRKLEVFTADGRVNIVGEQQSRAPQLPTLDFPRIGSEVDVVVTTDIDTQPSMDFNPDEDVSDTESRVGVRFDLDI